MLWENTFVKLIKKGEFILICIQGYTMAGNESYRKHKQNVKIIAPRHSPKPISQVIQDSIKLAINTNPYTR